MAPKGRTGKNQRMSWAFTLEKIGARIDEIGKAQVRGRKPLEPFAIIRGAQAYGPSWQGESSGTLGVNGTYTAVEETVTLRQTVAVPQEWSGQKLFLALELGGAETLAYLDGAPAQAIDKYHHELLLADPAEGGRAYDVALAAYTGTVDALIQGGWSGAGEAIHDDVSVTVVLRTAEMQWIDRDAESLYYDMSVAYESIKTMDASSREYVVILELLDAATNILDFTRGSSSDAFYASAGKARAFLQENLYQKYHADPNFAPTLWASGHAHIDTAWLWRLSHTHQKIARSFTNALTLMEQYPEYRFSASQAQQYAYLKDDYPEVYERLKSAVARGQWEPVGGMWVESDCNVVSGESLVRQFLFGQRFFKREFGHHSTVAWLPDVFGYSAAFPQIVRRAGMKYFMTIKIYWNEVNKPPYQTFQWEGLDGTTILTHFSPLGDYNAHMTPEQWRKNWTEYKQKNVSDSDLYIFGWGDGGGGPTRQMLETAERGKDFPGMPRVKLSTNQEFFEDLDAQVSANPRLPRWVGELYLEFHRGTYTSQARNKQYNRRAEFLLQAAEQIASLAMLQTSHAYPQQQINTAWEMTLLNQFHDIIPGSSIHAVYEDSWKDYEQVLQSAGDAAAAALNALAAQVPADSGNVVLYNPLSWQRSDVAELPRGLNLPGQPVTDFDGNEKTLVQLPGVPSLGYAVHPAGSLLLDTTNDRLVASSTMLENQFFKITMDENGEMSSVYDKRENREVIDAGSYCRGNALLAFEDKPLVCDAWNVDIFYTDKMTAVRQLGSIEVIETGPLRATVEIKRTFGAASHITQRISLHRDLPRIDIACDVEWQERQTLLKVAFPVTIHAARATYDIQFGNVERPTHWNTSWDWARFEVCGQKWADLSEAGYGVSLLSDSKYGWDIKGNVMRLTLLKGAIGPDPDADRGRHQFAYALYPHAGNWRAAETVQRAYEFNAPIHAAAAQGSTEAAMPPAYSLVSVDAPNIIVETIKKAEDDDTALIVRFYETYGQRGRTTLKFGRPVRSLEEVNLLEESDDSLPSDASASGSMVTLTYRPYDLRTLKIRC